MLQLRKSVAEEILFVLIDTNGVEVPGLGSTYTLQLVKPGASAFAASAGTKSEIGLGFYKYVTTTGETDTEGELGIVITGAGVVQQNLVYQVGGLAIWSSAVRSLTQGASQVAAVVVGSEITVYRGTTWSISLTGLGSITTYDVIYFSVKSRRAAVDNDAILRVDSVDGLERFNGAAPIAASNGTITIDNATNGDITITIQEEETIIAPVVDELYYDVKGVDNDGNVDLLADGDKAFNISGDITRAIA